jgi:hypothetical protein
MTGKNTLFFFIACMLVAGSMNGLSCKQKALMDYPDVSNIAVSVDIIHFENIMAEATAETYHKLLDSLEKKYPDFFQLYIHDIWNIPAGDSLFQVHDTLYKYLITDSYMNRLYDSVVLLYANMTDVTHALESAFKYYAYYFPTDTLPQVYTYIAPFVYQVVLGKNNVLGIELNMFMGKNFAYYGSFEANLPQYILYNFERRNIPVQVLRMLLDDKIQPPGADATLLDNMITQGKILYCLDAMLPHVPDSVKIGYSEKQMDWCEGSEPEIWKFFAGEELLFSKKIQDMQRYIGDAPNTYSMPAESPGRVAVWTGWQIVRAYMRNNEYVTLQELLQENDAMKILRESNYTGE